ncbi:Hypothetical Protein FCC1311_111932 [Hondaea fermentalgiana]|uniref:WW domain-containing protein n=1 Tax=Hondaea fermentalgiana TaxID=2315210 RepID=A0A2R5GVV2_9STRA|nr:Hypothetical Protein FCC1311_111932 [Hondaea fermentalgiana]|eukprot:GBG34970.1 Hypothetical Protein FCC1311_111932 [Hondaea fermentalgiana]
MLLLVIEKAIDGDGNEYYFNTLTNTSSWTKPSVLANVNPMTPRRRKQRALAQKRRDAGLYKSASMLAPAEAATMIQSWYRGRRAISRLREVLTGYIAKAHDAEGNLYYINLDTNEATWEKPTLLRDMSDSKLASFKDNMW